MATIARIRCIDDTYASVFFNADWDAYGWKTENFTNGPFDTAQEAAEALVEELGNSANDAPIHCLLNAARKHDA